MMLCENAETLQRDHDIAGPAIQRVDHDDLHTPGLHFIKELLKRWAFGNLFPACASLIILKKLRSRQITKLTGICEPSLLSVNTKVIFLHLAGATNIASDNHRRGIKRIMQRNHVFLLSPVHRIANGGREPSSPQDLVHEDSA